MGLLDRLRNWIKPDETPEPEPTPAPPREPTSLADYMRAWRMLKEIPLKRIWPALLSVPVIVFFAVSGMAAWLLVLAGFALRLLRLGLGN